MGLKAKAGMGFCSKEGGTGANCPYLEKMVSIFLKSKISLIFPFCPSLKALTVQNMSTDFKGVPLILLNASVYSPTNATSKPGRGHTKGFHFLT